MDVYTKIKCPALGVGYSLALDVLKSVALICLVVHRVGRRHFRPWGRAEVIMTFGKGRLGGM